MFCKMSYPGMTVLMSVAEDMVVAVEGVEGAADEAL